MKCIYVGCKCNATVLMAKNWANGGIVGFCDKHLPAWAKSKVVGLESPKHTGLSIPALNGKSFYQITKVV